MSVFLKLRMAILRVRLRKHYRRYVRLCRQRDMSWYRAMGPVYAPDLEAARQQVERISDRLSTVDPGHIPIRL